MLSASTPVCYALVLEAIKGNNAIIESGKKYAYISIYATNVGMLFGFEDHVNRILAPNWVRGIFHHKKNSGHPLEQNIVVSHERSSPDFRDG